MPRLRLATIVLLAAALAAAGCSFGDDSGILRRDQVDGSYDGAQGVGGHLDRVLGPVA